MADLVGSTDIADRLHVKHKTVNVWHSRGILPKPDYVISGTPIWEWSRIASWAEQTHRLPAQHTAN